MISVVTRLACTCRFKSSQHQHATLAALSTMQNVPHDSTDTHTVSEYSSLVLCLEVISSSQVEVSHELGLSCGYDVLVPDCF
jgi:hypothetical protein